MSVDTLLKRPQENPVPRLTIAKVQEMLQAMSPLYEIVRLVNPSECYELSVTQNGKLDYRKNCFSVWGRSSRCKNCISYNACVSHKVFTKSEIMDGREYVINARPVEVEMETGELMSCTIEMVTLKPAELGEGSAVRDDSREKSNYATALYNLRHDLLTRIYNMKGFSESLRERLHREPDADFDLVQIKIRRFDLITQLFGANKCDRLLIGLARYLETLHEPYDALYGRISRDNFALCVPHGVFADIPLENELKLLAGNLMGQSYHVHYRVGVYEKLDRGYSLDQMLDRTAMAIQSIRTQDVYAEERFERGMLEAAVKERQLLNDFDDALKNGELRLFLQPQIGLDGRMHRAEALSRWFHKDWGLIMPGDFIPILERSDNIYRMDHYIWEQAAKQLAIWEKAGHGDVSISVNVSPKDLYYGDVADIFIRLAEKYRINPARLHLEITESTIIENFDACNHIIEKLRARGFVVGLDDFGSGYSSLNMLQNIQADVLKLDMGFLRKLDHWERGKQIIKLVIDLAKTLDMTVVAEGVETEEQVRFLQELQCDFLQGFYFSKPIAVEEFEKKYFERTIQSGT